MTKVVKFLKQYLPYNVGDVASFEVHHAKAFVDSGIAKYVADHEPKKPEDTKVIKPTKSADVITKG